MKVDDVAMGSKPIPRVSIERELKLRYLAGLRASGRIRDDEGAARFLESAEVVWKFRARKLDDKDEELDLEVESITIEWTDEP